MYTAHSYWEIKGCQKTPHTSPSKRSYGMYIVRIGKKIDRVITASHCSCLFPYRHTKLEKKLWSPIFDSGYIRSSRLSESSLTLRLLNLYDIQTFLVLLTILRKDSNDPPWLLSHTKGQQCRAIEFVLYNLFLIPAIIQILLQYLHFNRSETPKHCRAGPRLASSQWETSLQSNVVSHWLGTNL